MLERLPRSLARVVIALLLAVAGWCLVSPGAPAAAARHGEYTDLMLYHDIVDAVRGGTPYHQAAAQLQRAHGYPTQPFVTMREPTLYVAAARFGWDWMGRAALLLVLGNIALWTVALPAALHPAERFGAVAGIAVGSAGIAAPEMLAFSELWCGLLLGLALALRSKWRERWWLALIAAGLALAIRELALPYVLLSAAFAAWERRWREVAGWAALVAAFALGMALHAHAEAAQVRPGDIASPGWSGGQGLRGFLMAVAYTSVLQPLWQPLALLLSLIPLLGWAALGGRGSAFALLLLGGYALMIALFARPDNFYWGFIVLPAWFAGFALAPRGVGQLWRAATAGPPGITGR